MCAFILNFESSFVLSIAELCFVLYSYPLDVREQSQAYNFSIFLDLGVRKYQSVALSYLNHLCLFYYFALMCNDDEQ
jgi:hypothetical protein